METETQLKNGTRYKFEPSKELLDFAKDFSGRYKILSEGVYRSNENTYTINYVDVLTDNNLNEKRSPVGVNHLNWVIDINRKIIMSELYTPDFIYLIILWCIIRKDVNTNEQADILAISHCLKEGMSKKNIALGYLSMLDPSKYGVNNHRYMAIEKAINEFKG